MTSADPLLLETRFNRRQHLGHVLVVVSAPIQQLKLDTLTQSVLTAGLRNVAAALFRLENSRAPDDIERVVVILVAGF